MATIRCAQLKMIGPHRGSGLSPVTSSFSRRNALPIRQHVPMRVHGIRVEDAHTTIAALSGRVLRTVKPSWFVFPDGVDRSTLSVGPRPERPAFVEQLRGLIPYYYERHTVRSGLT